MSNSDASQNAAGNDSPLDQVLKLATKTAKNELGGPDAQNKKVTATAALSTKVTEGDSTKRAGVNATVSLGVSSSTGTAEAECCCAASGQQSSCCCAKAKK